MDSNLPEIPQKLYFAIGEVSRLCDLKPHVLRYWEQEFAQLSPSKRRGNRRYYQHKDVVLVRQIKHLLYDQGYTIEGARQQLSSAHVQEQSQPVEESALIDQQDISTAIDELKSLLTLLSPGDQVRG